MFQNHSTLTVNVFLKFVGQSIEHETVCLVGSLYQFTQKSFTSIFFLIDAGHHRNCVFGVNLLTTTLDRCTCLSSHCERCPFSNYASTVYVYKAVEPHSQKVFLSQWIVNPVCYFSLGACFQT